MQTTIDKIEQHAQQISAGEIEQVKPGMPAAFTDGCTVGDAIRQGDLYLVIVSSVPSGYVEVKNPTKADKQLVPGNTQGARHCLDTLTGVKMFRPEKWDAESLDGPCLIVTKTRNVLHPTHGSVTIPAGMIVQCLYQREWSKEEAKQRRARD